MNTTPNHYRIIATPGRYAESSIVCKQTSNGAVAHAVAETERGATVQVVMCQCQRFRFS